MTKQGEVRDWHEDKEPPSYSNILMRLAKANERAIAEKERADKLQVELSEYTEAHWKAFERERKLREAIEQTIKDMGGEYYTKNPIVNRLMNVLYLLYPDKEGEAK